MDDANNMEDEDLFNSEHDLNAPGLVQIGTNIQPGMLDVMSLLYAIQEAMQFAHDNTDPSFMILPIQASMSSSKHEKDLPEYLATIAKYIFIKLKFSLNMKGFDEDDEHEESSAVSGGKKKKSSQVWGCLRVSANDELESTIMDIHPDLMELGINVLYKRIQLPDTYALLDIVGSSNAFCDVGLDSELNHHMKVT